MSAIHRVDDMSTMDGPRFFQFALRLPAYRGVMRQRIQSMADTARDAPVEATPASVAAHGLDDIISFG